jgi:hypothetical protein
LGSFSRFCVFNQRDAGPNYFHGVDHRLVGRCCRAAPISAVIIYPCNLPLRR